MYMYSAFLSPQAAGEGALTVGYVMKLSREEDFAKVFFLLLEKNCSKYFRFLGVMNGISSLTTLTAWLIVFARQTQLFG